METETLPTTQANPLIKAVNESGLEKTKAQILLSKFQDFFELASGWEAKAKALKVTSVTQKAEMKMAREGRLFLRQKRIEVENTRKALKADALREGQTIDALAKILTNLIAPIEEDLEKKEKYAEIQEANRIKALGDVRLTDIGNGAEFIPIGTNLGILPEDEYMILKTTCQLQAEEKASLALQEAENQRKKAEEDERIRKENEALRAQLKAKEEAEKKLADQQAAEDRKKQLEVLMPDKDKLSKFAIDLETHALPIVESPEAQKIVDNAKVLLLKISTYIHEQTRKL